MRYEDFNIRIMSKRDDGYDVSVDSPAGGASEHIKLPFEVAEALARIREIGGAVRGAATREVEFEADEAMTPAELGTQLYDALFSGAVGKMYNRSYAALSDPDVGLRIKLHLNLEDPGVSELAQIPWEYVYESDTMEYLTLSRQTPIVRYIEVQRSPTAQALPGHLKILVVMSSPNGVQALDLEKERRLIESSWAGEDNVEVDFLEHPTPDTLLEALVNNQYHVLHYMGHGAYDHKTGAGALILEDENHDAVMLDAQALGTWLRDAPTIRLIFLNACDTARTDAEEPFAGVANRLVMAGVPAVLAMQFPITDEAAIDFAKAFYPRLVAGFPVDEATSQGRKAILAGKTGTIEWGTPVLYMRAPDGLLFDTQAVDTASTPGDGGGQSEPPRPAPSPGPAGRMDVNYTYLGIAAAVVIAALLAWWLWPGGTEWKLRPVTLEIGEETTVRAEVRSGDDWTSYSKEYDPILKGDQYVAVPVEMPKTGSWEWTVTAIDLPGESAGNEEPTADEEAAAEGVSPQLTLEVPDKGDDERKPHRIDVKITVRQSTAEAYTAATNAVTDPAAGTTTTDLVTMLNALAEEDTYMSRAMNTRVTKNLEDMRALLEARAKAEADSLNEELTLRERIASLQAWKDAFEGVRVPLPEDTTDHLVTRLEDYSGRTNVDKVIFCGSYDGCTESMPSVGIRQDLYTAVLPRSADVTCQIVGPEEARPCLHDTVPPNARARWLNRAGTYYAEVRNSNGDLLVRQAVESQ